MKHAQLLESIRQLVAQTLLTLGAGGDEQPRESLLIQDGLYCGRRFEFSSSYAIWRAEQDEVTFYHTDGSFLRAIGLSESEPMLRRAA